LRIHRARTGAGDQRSRSRQKQAARHIFFSRTHQTATPRTFCSVALQTPNIPRITGAKTCQRRLLRAPDLNQ
jgi:hypothetical protein